MEDVAKLVNDILNFHGDIKKSALTNPTAFRPSPTDLSCHNTNNGWLLALQIDEAFLRSALLRLCAMEKAAIPGKAMEIERFAEAIRGGRVDGRSLQQAILMRSDFFQQLQSQFGVDSELMYTISLNSLRPIFAASLEKSEMTSEGKNQHGKGCPFCGAMPAMARIENKSGNRKLWCSVCNQEWYFKRIQCPFCLNEDQETLDYFFLDDGKSYRVDVCRVCNDYIKTVLSNDFDLEEVDFLLADIDTSYLDLLAKQEGFMKLIQGE